MAFNTRIRVPRTSLLSGTKKFRADSGRLIFMAVCRSHNRIAWDQNHRGLNGQIGPFAQNHVLVVNLNVNENAFWMISFGFESFFRRVDFSENQTIRIINCWVRKQMLERSWWRGLWVRWKWCRDQRLQHRVLSRLVRGLWNVPGSGRIDTADRIGQNLVGLSVMWRGANDFSSRVQMQEQGQYLDIWRS